MFDTWVVGCVVDNSIGEDFLRLTDFPEYIFNIDEPEFKNAVDTSTKNMSYRLKIDYSNDFESCGLSGFGMDYSMDNQINLVKFTIMTDILDFTAIISRFDSKYSTYLEIIVLVSDNKIANVDLNEVIRCKKETRRFLTNFINAYSANKFCDKNWINEDKIIKCIECLEVFLHSEADQEFYDFKKWDCPIRCKNCRVSRRDKGLKRKIV